MLVGILLPLGDSDVDLGQECIRPGAAGDTVLPHLPGARCHLHGAWSVSVEMVPPFAGHSLCCLPARLTDCLQFYSLVLSGRTLSHSLPQVLTAKGTYTCLDPYQNISLMRCQGAGGLCPQPRAASPLFS